MAIYDFRGDPKKTTTSSGPVPEKAPAIDPTILDAASQEQPTRIFTNDLNVDHTERHVVQLRPAFFHVDQGLLAYFGDIQVPSTDGVRSAPMRVRIAGGEKSILIWEEELEDGSKQVRLPVMSLNRENVEPNKAKQFSSYHWARSTLLDNGRRARLSFAPKAFILNYTASIWANRKGDIEIITQQIVSRFDHGNMDRFGVDMGNSTGDVIIELMGIADSSEKDVGPDEQAKVRYDISFRLEAWLPTEEVIVPTILGRVTTLHEHTGTFLEVLDRDFSSFATAPFNLPGPAST